MAEEQNRSLNDKFMLRLPDGMRDRLKRAATDNKRSLNAEIIARLEDSFANQELFPVADRALDSLEDSIRESREMLEMQRDLVDQIKGLRSVVEYIVTNENQPDPELRASLRAILKTDPSDK